MLAGSPKKTALLLRSGTEVWWARALPAHWYDWLSLHRVASCECTKTATRGERRERTPGQGWPRVLRHITMTHERPDPSPDPQLQNCSRHAPSRHSGPALSNSHRRFDARIPDCSTGTIYRAALQRRVEWEPAEVLWTISGLCVSFAGCLRPRLQQTPSRVQPLHLGPAHLKLTSLRHGERESDKIKIRFAAKQQALGS